MTIDGGVCEGDGPKPEWTYFLCPPPQPGLLVAVVAVVAVVLLAAAGVVEVAVSGRISLVGVARTAVAGNSSAAAPCKRY